MERENDNGTVPPAPTPPVSSATTEHGAAMHHGHADAAGGGALLTAEGSCDIDLDNFAISNHVKS